jgi:hypothetical protein
MNPVPMPAAVQAGPDWELDYYSRPILDAEGKKRWELLICSTRLPDAPGEDPPEPGDKAGNRASFQWVRSCPAGSVNSLWLREALEAALEACRDQGFGTPRRLRCWRGSMRTMVQRAAEGLGLELVASRRCYGLVEWLQERQSTVYPQQEGFMAGPLAPPAPPIQPPAVPLPEAARGESWSWATLPAAALAEAVSWEIGFAGLIPLPAAAAPQASVPGIRLFSRRRALAIAGWLAGLEPVRLEISGEQLVLEAGLEDRWLLATLPDGEARAADRAFAASREQAGGLQFIAVQASEEQPRFEGFWMLRDLPDG